MKPGRVRLAGWLIALTGWLVASDAMAAEGGPLGQREAALHLTTAELVAKVRRYRSANEARILEDFRQFLALPNLSSDKNDMLVNARWIQDYLKPRGFTSEVVSAGGAPYVLAERTAADPVATVLIYAHFDGQPVTRSDWLGDPFEPVLRDDTVERGGNLISWSDAGGAFDPGWRLFARSAGDDKAPLIALMAAVEALDSNGIAPRVTLKLVLDGEEEVGSPTLGGILDEHAPGLDADLMLFCDGPMHQSGRRQLVFGVRGSMTVDLTTYGANRPLHSGHYGNWAPNPTDALVRLLGSLKDDQGRIQIERYYDEVRAPTDAEVAAIAAMPAIDEVLQRELSLGRREGGEARLETLLLEPAIVVKGLQAGAVGAGAANVIRPVATASLNLRLVPDQTPELALAHLERHIGLQGFHIVHEPPGEEVLQAHLQVVYVDSRGGYPGFRTSLSSPAARQLVALLDELDGEATLLTPTMGGSLPIYLFDAALDMPIVLLPIANHDNNQHGANENLRLQNLWDAIEIYALIAARYGT